MLRLYATHIWPLMNKRKSILPRDVISCIVGRTADSSKVYHVEANIAGFDYTHKMVEPAIPRITISYHN